MRGGYSDTYLSLKNTQWLKGATAILIVFHHLSQKISLPAVLAVMGYIGFILVAVFFFLSGYGLMYGFLHKESYMDGFLKKKMFRLYLPYWVVITALIIIKAATGTTYSARDYVLSYLGIDMISSLWFVTAIILMYLFFWISFRISQKYGLLILIGFITIYCIVGCSLQLQSSTTASVFAFTFGTAWSRFETNWKEWVRQRYWLKLVLTAMLFIILFAGRLVLSMKGIGNEAIHLTLRNIISIAFVMLIMAIAQKVEFKSGLIFKAGGLSYELYMVHLMFLSVLPIAQMQENLYIVVVAIGAAVISIGLHQACGRIQRTIPKIGTEGLTKSQKK